MRTERRPSPALPGEDERSEGCTENDGPGLTRKGHPRVRLVSLAVAAAVVVALSGAIAVACYTVPRPDCGFVCGPGNACPDGYTCADDHRCHRIGAPADLMCTTVDAPLPVDAGPDAADDGMIDATAAP